MVTISTFGKLQRNIREDIFNFLSTSESNSQFRGLEEKGKVVQISSKIKSAFKY